MSRQNRDAKLRRLGWGTLFIFHPDLAASWFRGKGRPTTDPYEDLKLVTDVALIRRAENCSEAVALDTLQQRGWYPRGMQKQRITDAKRRLKKRGVPFPE